MKLIYLKVTTSNFKFKYLTSLKQITFFSSGHLERLLHLATSKEFSKLRFRELRNYNYTPEKFTSIGVGTSPFSKMRTPNKSPRRSLKPMDIIDEEDQEEGVESQEEEDQRAVPVPRRVPLKRTVVDLRSGERSLFTAPTPRTALPHQDSNLPLLEQLRTARTGNQVQDCITAASKIVAESKEFKCPFCEQFYAQKKNTQKHLKSKSACPEIRQAVARLAADSEEDADVPQGNERDTTATEPSDVGTEPDATETEPDTTETEPAVSETSSSIVFTRKGKVILYKHY